MRRHNEGNREIIQLTFSQIILNKNGGTLFPLNSLLMWPYVTLGIPKLYYLRWFTYGGKTFIPQSSKKLSLVGLRLVIIFFVQQILKCTGIKCSKNYTCIRIITCCLLLLESYIKNIISMSYYQLISRRHCLSAGL